LKNTNRVNIFEIAFDRNEKEICDFVVYRGLVDGSGTLLKIKFSKLLRSMIVFFEKLD
jgi:hypothetical protein